MSQGGRSCPRFAYWARGRKNKVLLDMLTRRHERLRHRLQAAYGMDPWPSARIDRLANLLAATERALARLQAGRGIGADRSVHTS